MKKFIRISGVLALVVTILVSMQFRMLDGWGGLFFSSLGCDTTIYAPAYSDSAFRKVQIGMTKAEVLALLGEPLDAYSIDHMPSATGMRWSKTRSDGDYRVRVVIFEDGKVKERISEYYLD